MVSDIMDKGSAAGVAMTSVVKFIDEDPGAIGSAVANLAENMLGSDNNQTKASRVSESDLSEQIYLCVDLSTKLSMCRSWYLSM